MAATDPKDGSVTKRWTVVEWLKNITGAWRNQGPQVLVDGGGIRDVLRGNGEDTAKLAVAAMKRVTSKRHATGVVQTRKDEACLKNKVYSNDIEPIVRDKLRSMFHEDNYDRMKLSPSSWTNTMRRIVDDISILYEAPATRHLETDDKANATQQTSVEQMANDKPTPLQRKAPTEDAPQDGQQEQGEEGVVAAPVETAQQYVDQLADVLELNNDGTKKERTAFDDLMEAADLDVVLDSVEKLCRIHEAVWVRPFVTYNDKLVDEESQEVKGDPSTAKLDYIVYTPEHADVIEDPSNPSQALAWFYMGKDLDHNGEEVEVVHLFTADAYVKFDKEWKVLAQDVNPIGRLPVTVFRKELPSANGYYCNGVGRDLLAATAEFNVLRTIQTTRYRDSGFKQLALVNVDEKDVSADMVLGGPTPIFVPDGGSATVLDMNPMLKEMSDNITERAQELAATYGISAAEYKADGAPQSGFAKKLDRDRVLKENRRIRKFFAAGEKDLYNCTAKTLEQYPVEGIGTLDATAKYVVDFGEPSFEEDPLNENRIDAQAIALGKTNIIDVLSRDNPDLNDRQLVELAFRNRRINEVFGKVAPQSMTLIDVLSGAQQQQLSFERVASGQKGKEGPPQAKQEDPNGDAP